MDDIKCAENELSTDTLLEKIKQIESLYNMETQTRDYINRTCFGWGVVHGLKVECKKNGVCIGDGLAFDIEGNEICLQNEKFLNYADIFEGWEPDEGSWGLCISKKDGLHLQLKGSREEGDICIAIIHTGWHGPRLLVEGIDSPIDTFHRSGNIYPEEKLEHGTFSVQLGNGKVYKSREIEHGLGNASVEILLQIKGIYEDRECVLCGDIPGIRYGVRIFQETGTFMASFESDDTTEKFFQVEWFAHKLN